MSLTIDLSVSIASTRDSFTITDNTVYGTGDNPARNALKLYLSAYKMSYGNEATPLSVESYTPASVTDWGIEYTIDGWYKVYFAAFEQYNAGTTYNQYDAVYNGSVVYRSKVGSNLGQDTADITYWEVISDPASLANNKGESNESANINSLVYNRVFAANGQYTYGNLISDGSTCTDCDEAVLLAQYDLFDMWLSAMAVADAREEVLEGEEIARKIQSRYIDC